MELETSIFYGCLCCPTPQAEAIRNLGERCELCWHWYQLSEMYNPTKGVYVCQECWG